MYADIEAFLTPLEVDDNGKTQRTLKHILIAIGSMVISRIPGNELHEKYVVFNGLDCMSKFIDYLEELCVKIHEWDPSSRAPADRTGAEKLLFNISTNCYMCKRFLDGDSGKNFDNIM